MSPTATNGKICYVEIPTGDVEASAAFYREVFGWSIRTRGDGATAFDDTTGQVSGAFVTGRPAMSHPGPLVYVMVDDAEAACRAVAAAGRDGFESVCTGVRSFHQNNMFHGSEWQGVGEASAECAGEVTSRPGFFTIDVDVNRLARVHLAIFFREFVPGDARFESLRQATHPQLHRRGCQVGAGGSGLVSRG